MALEISDLRVLLAEGVTDPDTSGCVSVYFPDDRSWFEQVINTLRNF
jgi:hypothetical protein